MPALRRALNIGRRRQVGSHAAAVKDLVQDAGVPPAEADSAAGVAADVAGTAATSAAAP